MDEHKNIESIEERKNITDEINLSTTETITKAKQPITIHSQPKH